MIGYLRLALSGIAPDWQMIGINSISAALYRWEVCVFFGR